MKQYNDEMTADDLAISATLRNLPSLNHALNQIKGNKFNAMIDLGCASGAVTKYVAKYLHVDEIYGIDIDEERLRKAQLRGINTYKFDFSKKPLPFTDSYFDLVTLFGTLEHIVHFDNVLSESFRILKNRGYIIIAMPNLGSYLNIIALLLGYQPRDVEISSTIAAGALPVYSLHDVWGHVHSATLRAVKQMLKYYGFSIIKVNASPTSDPRIVVKIIDKILAFSPRLSRRFIIISQKA